MRGNRTWALLAGVALVLTACTESTPTSTLAPGTTAPVTTASTTTSEATTTEAPTTTTSTTSIPPTTTEDPDARLAEIQVRVEEAVLGRLQAIYDKDVDALLQWAGSQSEYEGGLEAMDRDSYIQRPDSDLVSVAVEEILLDRSDCVVTVDRITVGDGVIRDVPAGSSASIGIWWPAPDGRFLHGAVWQVGTPQSQWMEECDIAVRGVAP